MTQIRSRTVAVVVTHNRLPQLQRTLKALLDCEEESLAAIIVIDNDSTDGTAAWLTSQLGGRLHVETLSENRGGAGGFAFGMQYARELFDPDWIVVMDDDARPEVGALQTFNDLVTLGKLDGIDGVAAAVRHPDGKICRMNRPTVNPFWHVGVFFRTLAGGGRAAFHLTDQDFDTSDLCPIDGASFVGLFLSRRAIDLAGYPDPALFLYADDAIFTMTLTRRGGRMLFAPEVRFEHDTTALAGGGAVTPIWKAYYYHRNRLLLYRLAAGATFWLFLPILLWRWPRLANQYPPEERAIFRRLIWRAFRDAISRDLSLDHASVLSLASGLYRRR
ncbi:MAG: glycosyltransferase [Paracoccaceae bacterium]